MFPRSPALAVLLASCGPSTTAGDGTAGGSASSGRDDTGTSLGATDAVSDTGSGPGSTSEVADSTGEPPPVAWCLRGVALPQLEPDDHLLAIEDVDGDGRDEVWLAQSQWDPVLEQQSTRLRAYALGDGEALEPVVDVVREGDAFAMADIDGDGRRDVLLRQWNQPEDWWLAGLAGVGIDELPVPLGASSTRTIWVDANADGLADALVPHLAGAFVGVSLLLGDGEGGLIETDTLASPGFELNAAEVWPSSLPGRLVVEFEELTFGFGSKNDTLIGIAVSPAGEITVLAQSDALDIHIAHVDDLDGDAVPDVLGFNPLPGTDILTVHQGAPGQYVVDRVEVPVRAMVVAPLRGNDELDMIQFVSDDEAFLRLWTNGTWAEALPLPLEGPPMRTSWMRPMQADGDPGQEILARHYGASDVFGLWGVEPCE